jgi:hypothetical protein
MLSFMARRYASVAKLQAVCANVRRGVAGGLG